MSFVSSKPDPYPTPVDVVIYLISAIMNRVIKRFYCTPKSGYLMTTERSCGFILTENLSFHSFRRDNIMNQFTICIVFELHCSRGMCMCDLSQPLVYMGVTKYLFLQMKVDLYNLCRKKYILFCHGALCQRRSCHTSQIQFELWMVCSKSTPITMSISNYISMSSRV